MKAWMRWSVVLCAVLAFLPARRWGELHDDLFLRGPGSMVADPRAGLADLWRTDVFGTYETPTGQSGFWRPLTLLAFRLEWVLTDGRPVPYAWLGHVVNLCVHAAASLALRRVLCGLGLSPEGATLAAVLFALHPVHPESVVWVSSLGDLAAVTLAWTATAWMLAPPPGSAPSSAPSPSADASTRPSLGAACTVGATFALLAALLFKESVVLLVGLAGLLARLRGRPWRAALVPPTVAVAAYAVLRTLSFDGGLAPEAYTGPADPAVRWWTWLSILPDLVRFAVWPGPATPLHPVAPALGWGSPGVLPGLVLLSALLVLTAWSWRARAAAPAFALLLLSGVCLLLAPWRAFPIGYEEIAAPLYERHLYAAAAAVPALFALALGRRLDGRPAVTLAAVAASAALLVPVTRARAEVWRSDQDYATAALRLMPESPTLWNHLGVAHLTRLQQDGDAEAGEAALDAFGRALALRAGRRDPLLNRFITLCLLGRTGDAADAARHVLQMHGDDPGVLDNVARWHMAEGRWDEAAALLAHALETGEAWPGTQEALALCLRRAEAREGRRAPAAPPATPSVPDR